MLFRSTLSKTSAQHSVNQPVEKSQKNDGIRKIFRFFFVLKFGDRQICLYLCLQKDIEFAIRSQLLFPCLEIRQSSTFHPRIRESRNHSRIIMFCLLGAGETRGFQSLDRALGGVSDRIADPRFPAPFTLRGPRMSHLEIE